LTVLTDLALIPHDERVSRYLLATVSAPSAAPSTDRRPVNLSLVLDRSGSMNGQKIEQAREAAAQTIRRLRASDRFSVVTYNDQVDVVVPSTPATPQARAQA